MLNKDIIDAYVAILERSWSYLPVHRTASIAFCAAKLRDVLGVTPTAYARS